MSGEGKKLVFKVKKPEAAPAQKAEEPTQAAVQQPAQLQLTQPQAGRVIFKGVKIHIGEVILKEK